MRKKLLIATDCFLPRWDGVTRFMLEVIPKLSQDFKITIVAPDFGPLKEIKGVKVVRFPVMKIDFGDIEFTKFHKRKIKKLVKENDLVFSRTIGPIGLSAIAAAKRVRVPVVAYVHSIEWELTTRSIKRMKWLANWLTKRMAKKYYNRCNLLMIPSEEVMVKHKTIGIVAPKEIVHLGTNTDKFSPTDNLEASKEKIGLDPYEKIIGFTGRIGREKDLMTLYRAFRRVEKIHPNAKLMIVGKGVKELEDLFSSSRNIILPGSVNNVVDYLRAMDIFVLPSLTETSSLATMEAMACGLPVITTPVGFVKEYIRDKKNGMSFPFKNSLVLSMKINMLLENEELRHYLGENARKTIVENFRWKNTIERIKELLLTFSG